MRLLVSLLVALLAISQLQVHGDIYRWDNGSLIPGTDGIEPGPHLSFPNFNLQFADLSEFDLTDSSFGEANLANARFRNTTLTGVGFRRADLTDADFTGAIVGNASFFEARLTSQQLYSTASYHAKDLQGINLSATTLDNWNLSGQDLTNASLLSRMHGINLTDAVINGASFRNTVGFGFTPDVLYSTASYKRNDLSGIEISSVRDDLSGWKFANQNLTGARIGPITGADLSGADIRRAVLDGMTPDQLFSTTNFRRKDLSEVVLDGVDLTDADLRNFDLTAASFGGAILLRTNLTGAEIRNASLQGATGRGLSNEQIYSTASYQAGDLRGVKLDRSNLSGWNLSGQDLRWSKLGTQLDETDLTDAIVSYTDFSSLAFDEASGLSKQQLYSTRSYQTRLLHGIRLGGLDLSGWSFRDQDLSEAYFFADGGFGPDRPANISDADMTNSIIRGVHLPNVTQEQIYSTASYQEKNLRGIVLWSAHQGWNFRGQDLANSILGDATLTNADLRGANLKNARMSFDRDLNPPQFDSETVYNQWTRFPHDFDPEAAGLSFEESKAGDFDANEVLDGSDLELLQSRIIGPIGERHRGGYWRVALDDAMFDINGDSIIDSQDHHMWVTQLKRTWFGDANLDGQFGSADLVQVFRAGEFEDGLANNSHWSSGDWNADGDFTSSDLVVAFTDGGYEQGPRPPLNAVPEPSGALLVLMASLLLTKAPKRSLCGALSRPRVG